MKRQPRTPMLERPQTRPVGSGTTERAGRVVFCLGFDLGFASSPTAAALMGFDKPQPYLIATHTVRPLCGGTWQHRVDSVLEQLIQWLSIEVLPFYPPVLIVYSLPHLREQKGEEAKQIHKGAKERESSTKVLNPQTALKLADLGGGIRGVAIGFGLPVIGVQELESKVALASDPRATKGDMIRAARRIFERDFTEHEADAVGHTLAGEANYRRDMLIR